MDKNNQESTRRVFLKTGAGVAAAMGPLAAARHAYAAGSDPIRVGLIGCGHRGSGAASNILQADPAVELYAMADIFESQFDAALDYIQKDAKKTKTGIKGRLTVNKDRQFIGFDSYKKLVALDDLDIVLVTSPVAFHPIHLTASIEAGRHTFMEKPAAVDPVGARQVIAAGELAKKKGLAIVAGTQRRHQASYRRNYAAVQAGAVGQLQGGRVWWCTGDRTSGPPPHVPNETNAEYMIKDRSWYMYVELCGDNIVEQHVHNIDVANWFIGRNPVTALGFGGRMRRRYGDRYDLFSIDFDYGDGVTVHSMSRQIKDCYTKVSEHFIGTEGSLYGGGKVTGKQVSVPEFEEIGGPYVQEHRDLIASIRAGKPLNEAKHVADSTMTAIMGRISSYTGQLIRWTDLTENKESPYYNMRFSLTPEDFEKGDVQIPPDKPVMLPGSYA